MNRPAWVKATIALAVAACAMPTSAHHSFAMFDSSKKVTITGTVKEFQWTNPHIWVQVLVKDAAGKTVEWSIEGSSTNGLARNGWNRNSLKAGDQVVLVTNPLKTGQPGGSLVSVTVDGKAIGRPLSL